MADEGRAPVSRRAARAGAMAPERSPGANLGVSGQGKVSGANQQKQTPSRQSSSAPLSAVWDAMSEAELQQHVEDGLTTRGYAWWHVRDSRLMNAGLPDVIALGPLNGHGPIRLLFLELKRRAGRRRPKQREVIAYLQQVTTIDARFVEPADWPAILDTLGPPHA